MAVSEACSPRAFLGSHAGPPRAVTRHVRWRAGALGLQLEEDFVKANPEWVKELEIMVTTKVGLGQGWAALAQVLKERLAGECGVGRRECVRERREGRRAVGRRRTAARAGSAGWRPPADAASIPAFCSMEVPLHHRRRRRPPFAGQGGDSGAQQLWLPVSEPAIPAAQAAGGGLDLRRQPGASVHGAGRHNCDIVPSRRM